MSREIKFRAWNDAAKVMYESNIPGLLIHFDGELNGLDANGMLEGTDNTRQHQLMQYTGLKDKHGTEIFEGDIIYWEIDNGVGIESYTAIVKWSENLVEEGWSQTYKWLVGYTGNYYRGSYDELSTPAAYNDELQVIGNIYEHKHLLEETA